MSNNTISKSIIIGYVGQKPIFTEKFGKSFATFNLAVTHSFITKGEQFEKINWFNIIAYNSRAKLIDKTIRKGDLIYAECNIENYRFIDKEGREGMVDRYVLQKIKILNSMEKTPFHQSRDLDKKYLNTY